MTDLCREFGISRKTGYKLKAKFEERGVDALLDQSRAPARIPHRTGKAVRALLVATRKQHPTWGPKKIRAWLERKHPGVRLPAVSTIGSILKAEGLVRSKKRRRKRRATPTPRTEPIACNELWCADFKGQFQLGNGRLCYPLTITDAASRYLIACVALDGTKAGPAQQVFLEAFERFGLPERLRTDNGTPFASVGLGGFSKLNAWWCSLGITPERIEPGHPEQNGRHERMHRTLKAETTRPAGSTMLQQQERFDRFVVEFNEERPHEAIGQKPPASVYTSSERSLADVQEPDYSLDDLTLKVGKQGLLYLRGELEALLQKHVVYLSEALAGHVVGLRELDDGRWSVRFMDTVLGHLDPFVGGFDQAAELL
jgi:transposase InsO family protein